MTLVALFANAVSADDWTQWRGPDRANLSSEKGLFESWGPNGPKLAWTAKGLGSGYASVSVASGLIFTTGNIGNTQSCVAINASDGSVAWTRKLVGKAPEHGYPGSRTTPTVDGDNLYLVSSDGEIFCLHAKDGKIKWSRSFGDWNGKMMSKWGYSESPLIDGDHVICTPGGNKGMVVALNKNDGSEIWACKLPSYDRETGVNGKDLRDGAGYSSAVISNGGGVKQYVQLVGRGLIGIRASDGKLLWRYVRVSNGTANIPTAIVKDNLIFTSTGYNTGSALLELVAEGDGVAVKEKYWLPGRTFQNKHGGVTLVDGHLYCGHGNGNGLPICADFYSGEVTWGPERAKGKGEATLVYADGHLVVRRENGTVMLIKANPEKMEIVNSFTPAFQQGKTWAHPVIANGILYLREQDKLMAYKLK